ncbi:MAG: phosphoribosylaminoimidazolesuccinocarboxamide synthase [Planctomycetota bacterium]|nr:phosphoribosylaminoimidazolesuccinocarboxamide synthase [Planctomycetota bacterium]
MDVYLGRKERLGALELLASGKVRDIYTVDADHLLFVTSDRVSAFDVVMRQGIPHKGRVLTAVAEHWFERTADLFPNHLVGTDVADVPRLPAEEHDALRGRVMLVRRCEPTTVEWVVRGYITGSGWKEYQAKGSVCGIPLPSGLEFCQKLAQPLLTPTTKDGVKDLPLTLEEARERVGGEVFEEAREAAFALFARGTEELARIGILLADTKFEFGLCGGELVLIDEVLTPDSSRFWPAAEYATGRNQVSYDKQILRDWLETLDWEKSPPPPDVPADVIARVSERYLEICEKITGRTPVGIPV